MKLGGDNPVKRADDDLLGRAPLAKAFAENVVALDASEGVAVGVLGAWGSGKTSFINLARPHLEDAGITVVDFNPWMFSGSEQLVDAFFVETAAQLKLKPGFDDIAGRLEDYGDSLAAVGKLPFVGGWIVGVFGAAKLLAKHMDRRKSGVVGKRERLEEELRTLKHPIAIVLDDIDRLSKKEIQHVFRMVRLTASFTNLIYLVAFDRKRVEDALGDDGVPGRDYLEKILQVTIDLPVVPNKVMMTQLFGVINAAVKEAGDHGPFEEELWPDVLMEIVRPLIENMRDAKRYAVAVYGGVRAVGTKVALTDLLGLEAVRVFMPDVFQLLGRSVDCLTNSSVSRGIGDSTEEMKAEAQALIDAGGTACQHPANFILWSIAESRGNEPLSEQAAQRILEDDQERGVGDLPALLVPITLGDIVKNWPRSRDWLRQTWIQELLEETLVDFIAAMRESGKMAENPLCRSLPSDIDAWSARRDLLPTLSSDPEQEILRIADEEGVRPLLASVPHGEGDKLIGRLSDQIRAANLAEAATRDDWFKVLRFLSHRGRIDPNRAATRELVIYILGKHLFDVSQVRRSRGTKIAIASAGSLASALSAIEPSVANIGLGAIATLACQHLQDCIKENMARFDTFPEFRGKLPELMKTPSFRKALGKTSPSPETGGYSPSADG